MRACIFQIYVILNNAVIFHMCLHVTFAIYAGIVLNNVYEYPFFCKTVASIINRTTACVVDLHGTVPLDTVRCNRADIAV